MWKFTNMQTDLQNLQLEIFFQYWNRESKVNNCNRYDPPGHLLLWVSVWHLGRRHCLRLSLCCLLSRVLTLEGLEHVLCSSENIVNLPKLAGLQYGQGTPIQISLISPQERAEERWTGVLWLFQKLLLYLFKLSYRILFTTLTVKLKHSSHSADPVQYSMIVPKDVVMSLSTLFSLKHA